ncbi:MAG TPA: DUF2062 domain-containing protein [Vicinamibacterales bacterium]|jgi:uncharacterized protein (DUF2062 family)|nr:DUF2062 domain-containing protein [Vicinamibacterales bacterium]
MIQTRLCIPTYRDPLTLEQLVVDCLRETELPILLLDEGSDLPLASLVRQKEIELSIRTGRLQILRVQETRSKGSAIQAAIADSAGHGFTHLLTMDADGTNLAREVNTLVAVSHENPQDVILANRTGAGPDVRPDHRSTRRFTDFLVQYETKMQIRDPGSGFRIYPLAHVQNMRFRGSGPEFEIEALIRLLWKRVAIREVDTAICFAEPETDLKGYRKFTHDFRLSLLNTALATVSLLKTHRTPAEIGAAVGAGVFLGCTPFFGLHTLLAMALSFLFRLNFVYVLIGTQISNPFLAGFLTVASVGVGRYVIKTSSHTVAGFSLEWLVGSLVVGVTLGIASGLTSYLVARKFARILPHNAAS